MAIISTNGRPAVGKQGVPHGNVTTRAVEPKKGVIIEPSKKEQASAELKQIERSAEVFPFRFAALTAIVVMISVTTLAVLLDVSDSLRARSLKDRLASADTPIQVISDLVHDSVSFDSRVSMVMLQPQKLPNHPETTERKTAKNVLEQVLDIISTSNKRQKQARRLAMSIVSESIRQNYDPLFVAAVIKSESAFNEMAVSHKGAQGLMQIMPATGKYLSKSRDDIQWPTASKLTDAGYNLHLGIKYLKELEGMFEGNRLMTLIAYNWGPGKLDKAIRSGRGVPAECLHYALKILRDHKLWESDQDSGSANA